jgi:signal transduction histidine kinase/ActR/RegA family two-component response regulator
MYKDHERRPAGIVVILEDVTAQKRAEAERGMLAQQLRQAQKMEAIGTLAGGIAHDFNNILAAIVGYADITLLSLPKSSRNFENVTQIMKASLRARDLVQQILEFSRKAPAKEPSQVDWAPMVKETVKLLRATLPATIEIREHIIPSSGRVLADPAQLHQILMNLCMNARYALRENGGLLEVRLDRATVDAVPGKVPAEIAAGEYVRLTVRDTGSGMDEATLQRIFEPYFTTKPVGEGSGLGLAVVHGIVAALGGAVSAQSKPGAGSTFEVYLPEVRGARRSESPNLATIPEGTERILLVDDEAAVAEAGKQLLEALGYRVTAVNDSGEALELFRADPEGFDLVVTDQTLPRMTGETLTRELLKISPGLPVILCTGYSDVLDEAKAKASGALEYLMKPMDIRALAEAVRRALDSANPPA